MSDNRTEAKLLLTAEDRASAVIERLNRSLRASQAAVQNLARFRNPLDTNRLFGAGTTQLLDQYNRGMGRASREATNWAQAQARSGTVTMRMWRDLGRELDQYVDAHGNLRAGVHALDREEVRHFQRTVARMGALERVIGGFRNRYNLGAARQHNLEEQLGAANDRLATARHQAKEKREQRAHRDQRQRWAEAIRHSRNALNAPARMANRADGNGYFSSPAFVAMSGAAAAVAVARKAIQSATETDLAETYARLHMGMNDNQAQYLRQRTTESGLRMGVKPVDMLTATVEASKAGVPNDMAQSFGIMSTKLAEVYGMNIAQTTDDIGYAVAQELGRLGPEKFSLDSIRRMGNSAGYLASTMATRPDAMMSFMRTGMGSGALMGLTQADTLAFGAAATSAGAQGQQAARMLGHLGEQLHELPLHEQNLRRKKSKTAEDKLFLQIPQMLGYGSWGNVTGKMKRDPSELFTLIERFGKIKDPYKRDQALTAVFGADFKRFVANMATSPGVMKTARDNSRKAFDEDAGSDFITRAWAEFEKSLKHMLNRASAAWSALSDQLGRAFKPFVGEFADFFGRFARQMGKSHFDKPVQGLLRGLIQGLGFENLPALLNSFMPGRGRWDVSKFEDFGKGFSGGIKSIWETIKGIGSGFATVMKAFGFDTSSPKVIGELIGKILALSMAIHIARPAFSILGFVKDSIVGIASAFMGLSAILKVLGLGGFKGLGARLLPGLAARGGGAALGAGAAAAVAAVGLGVTILGLAAGVTLAVAIMNWDKITEFFNKYTSSGTPDNHKSPIEKDKSDLNWWEVDPLFHRQSYNPGDDSPGLNGNIRKANFTTLDDIGRGINRMASGPNSARFQLASLTGAGIGALGVLGVGMGGGSGGGGGGDGGGGFQAPNPGVPGWYGKGSGGGGGGDAGSYGGKAAYGMAGKTFNAKAPGIMQNLMKDFGLTKEQAAGIVGNLGHESAGFTAHQEGNPIGGGRGGAGWAQWTGPRRRQFEAWSAQNGLDPKSDEANYGFLKHELSTNYKGVIGRLKQTRGVEEATSVFEDGYEKAGVKHMDRRYGLARQAMGLDPNSATPNADAGSMAGTLKMPGANPADKANEFLGMGEARNRATLEKFMGGGSISGSANAWCARFVNASLEAVGQKGSGSQIANSFLRWGKEISADMVQKGDIGVEHRNKGVDAQGGHVGIATGNKRINPKTGELEFEMLQGNSSDQVKKEWEKASALKFRRSSQVQEQASAAAAQTSANAVSGGNWKPGMGGNAGALGGAGVGGGANGSATVGRMSGSVKPSARDLAKSVPNAGKQGGQRDNDASMGGGGTTVHAPVTIHAGNQTPAELGNHLQRHISDRWNYRSHDLEPELT